MVKDKPSSKEEVRQFMKDYSNGHASTVRKGEWDKVENVRFLANFITDSGIIINRSKEADVSHLNSESLSQFKRSKGDDPPFSLVDLLIAKRHILLLHAGGEW